MKLRESLYQREVYGPRIAQLREAADEGSESLIAEFDRILGKSVARQGDARGGKEGVFGGASDVRSVGGGALARAGASGRWAVWVAVPPGVTGARGTGGFAIGLVRVGEIWVDVDAQTGRIIRRSKP